MSAHGFRHILFSLSTAVVFLTVGALSTVHAQSRSAEAVLKDYVRAVYGRDASAAYALLSVRDREVKTLEDYARETAAFDGAALTLSKELAHGIEFDNVAMHIMDGLGHITFDATLPNANEPSLREVMHGFDPNRLAKLSRADIKALKLTIRERSAAGQLPVLKAEGERWSMIKEDGEWRVFENWAEAVEVNFEALTFHDLGWAFEPIRPRVMAKHGETIQMAYRAKNLGESEVTAKARHIIGPDRNADYLDIISCFCFLESTLAPGEEVELPLTFRVDYEAPEDVTAFTVKYEFYPADLFPKTEQTHSQVQG